MITKTKTNRAKRSTAKVVTPEVTPDPTPITPEVVTPEVVLPTPTGSLSVPGSQGEVIGSINLTSKRVSPGTALTTYRIVANQRKNVVARYYIQGGTSRIDPLNGREFFYVAVEIPHVDLHTAKLQLVQLRATLTPEVTKVA